jgi:Uma2 family endonuclease
MPTAALVSVEEYLHTSYEPDCDYVDGAVVERNVGERDHSMCQGNLLAFFRALAKKLDIYPFVEQRVQVRPERFRVPDICVTRGIPQEQIFRTPPLIVIEVLSPDDRIGYMRTKIEDYLNFGVRHVWIVDPESRRAYVCTKGGLEEIRDGSLRTEEPRIELPLAEIFADL